MTSHWLKTFTFLNLILVQFISILYVYQSGVYPSTGSAWFFLIAYWCGHFAFLALLSAVVTVPLYFLFGRGVWSRRVISIFAAWVLIFLFIDTFIYAQYRFHLNFIVLDLFLNGHGQIISFSFGTWALMIGILLGLIAGEMFLAELIFKKSKWIRTPKKSELCFYAVCFVLSQLGHAWADATYYTPVTRLATLLPLSFPLQAKSLFAKFGLVDAEEVKKRKQLRQGVDDGYMKYPLETLTCAEASKKPLNIVWLVVDSLRFDMLNETVMPNVFKFSQNATVFENHFSNSNSTRYGIFSLFYGIPGSYFDAAMKNQVAPAFMSELAKRGYNFGIFGNAPLTRPEFDQTVFLPVPNLRKMSKGDTVVARDIEISDEAIQFVKKQTPDKPFFTFLFYDAPHGYVFPKTMKLPYPKSMTFSYVELNANSDPTTIRQVYSNAVFFDDSEIQKILSALEKQNLLDSTLILITGDHGQEFNDTKHGYWGHNSNFSLYQTHVPLVLYWPGKAPQKISSRTTHFDVSTTLLTDLFQCEKPEAFSSGSNLFDGKGRDWFIMGREGDYAIRAGDKTTVVYPTGDYDIVDDTYTPIPGAKLDGQTMSSALKELRRFTK